ncbi:MAG: CBS domain-containing protein [Candidatus Marinimicrobia bacterium]|nr:CBS domain-containing protein [Candidatus Neomarinimicrobiota bacterium]
MDKPFSVKKYMVTKLVTFSPDMNALAAIRDLLNYKISGAPVLDKEGNIIGVFSEKDGMTTILDASYHNEIGALVSDLMSTQVFTVLESASIMEVAEKFLSTSFRRFPVVDKDERLVGQISRRDVLKAVEDLSKG